MLYPLASVKPSRSILFLEDEREDLCRLEASLLALLLAPLEATPLVATDRFDLFLCGFFRAAVCLVLLRLAMSFFLSALTRYLSMIY